MAVSPGSPGGPCTDGRTPPWPEESPNSCIARLRNDRKSLRRSHSLHVLSKPGRPGQAATLAECADTRHVCCPSPGLPVYAEGRGSRTQTLRRRPIAAQCLLTLCRHATSVRSSYASVGGGHSAVRTGQGPVQRHTRHWPWPSASGASTCGRSAIPAHGRYRHLPSTARSARLCRRPGPDAVAPDAVAMPRTGGDAARATPC